jgi:peptidoglycan/LPS O-acetylase OafA/YrhL
MQKGDRVDQKYASTKFITGMRGYSALAVFLIHSGGGGLREFSVVTDRLVDNGKYGVVSFFCISAFTIAMSLDNSEAKGVYDYRKYLINRFLRIFPLLFLALLYAFSQGGAPVYLDLFKVQNTVSNFLVQISLLNVFFVRHQNNLIGLEWSISVEAFYYLMFPAMFWLLFSKRHPLRTGAIALVSFLISFYSGHIFGGMSQFLNRRLSGTSLGREVCGELFNPKYADLAHHWGLLKYLFTFITGMILFGAFKTFQGPKKADDRPTMRNWAFVSVLVAGIAYLMTTTSFHMEFAVTLWVGALLYTSFHRGTPVKLVFENPVILHIGEISFSFYLLQYLVLYRFKSQTLPNVLLAFVMTVLLSTLTYRLVERPFMAMGHRLKNA